IFATKLPKDSAAFKPGITNEKEELSCISDNQDGRGLPVTRARGRGCRQTKAVHSEKEELSCISNNEDGRGLPVTRGRGRGRRQTKAVHREKEELLCISNNEDGCGLPVTVGCGRGRRETKAVHSEKEELSCISDTEDGRGLPVTGGRGQKKAKNTCRSEDGKDTQSQGGRTDKAEAQLHVHVYGQLECERSNGNFVQIEADESDHWWQKSLNLKFSDLNCIVQGFMLQDTVINAAQSILKKQFPFKGGFQSTLNGQRQGKLFDTLPFDSHSIQILHT
uniref:Uncharacterized protein n=1 Tax=Amphimedon queenslandica TaxID=400682 RepID=A0A1X7TFH0_AMPQE